jgi:hypothetical protein
MKKLLALVMALGASSSCSLSFAAEAAKAEPTPPPAAITLVNGAGVDSAMLERIRAYMQADLHVVVGHVSTVTAASVPAALKSATTTHAPQFCRVIFWRGESEIKNGFQLMPDARVVLVDTTPLLADHPDGKKLEGRLERQAMRGTGLLLGLEYVAGPPCTLKRIGNLKELDALSSNFSPPAQGKFRQLIQLEGVEILDQP